MKKQRALIIALFLVCGSFYWSGNEINAQTPSTQNQTGKISGIVTDSNGDPLIGASVVVKGTKIGVATDSEGRYSISAPKNSTLVISYVGCTPLDVKAQNASKVMLKNTTELNEVVITAEFGMKRVARSVGSSAQNIKASDIAESGRNDFISALQGRVSGMTVTNSSGAPGASTTVILRSATSLSGNNQPLYVVDGIPMNNSTFNPGTGFAVDDAQTVRNTDFASRGNDFNPEDIESMTVLKGAAAAALYGSDASNGAIIITTKKGASGKAKVSYSNQLAWSNAYGWPEVQNKYANGAYGTTNYYYTAHFGGLYDSSTKLYDNAAAIMQTGFSNKHNVSLEAGNDKMSIRASASFLNQSGVIKTTDLSRNNISISGRANINKWLSFEGSMQYVHLTNTKALRGTEGPLYRSYIWPNVDNMADYMATDGIHMKYPSYYIDTDLLNPMFALYKNKNNDLTDRFISSFSLNFTPIEHTFIRAQFGWDVSTSTYENATHPYYQSENQTATNGGVYNIAKYNTSDPTLNILAGYNNKFGKFNVGVQVGYHQLENAVTSLSSYGSNFKVIDFYSINNCTETTIVSRKRATKRRIQALSAQAEVGFDNMAFLTLRGRNDWSSTLPTDNNSFFYPAVELSYIFTELKPLKELTWLNFLKLRGSIAQVGKDAPVLSINPELEATGLWGGGYKYGFTGPNKNLKPEMTTSYEVGIEARAWDNRVNADFTLFKTHCADQIITGFRMSYATGFVLNNMNVGTFNTWGWEGHADVDIFRTRDFKWNVGINASHTSSKVVYLPENLSEFYNAYTNNSGNIRNGVMVGSPITTLTGIKYQRNSQGQVLINPTTGAPYVESENSILGDREPLLRFGITTNLSYKDFRLSAMFSGRYHVSVANITQRDMMIKGLNWESVDLRESGSYIFDGVLKDGNEESANPTKNNIALNMGQYGGTTIYTGTDEDWVQNKINYIRLQELRLTYTVPSTFLKKYTKNIVSYASIYVSGNDLFTLTNYTGYDVVGNTMSAAGGGTGGEGIDWWSLPSPRTYSFGVSLSF